MTTAAFFRPRAMPVPAGMARILEHTGGTAGGATSRGGANDLWGGAPFVLPATRRTGRAASAASPRSSIIPN